MAGRAGAGRVAGQLGPGSPAGPAADEGRAEDVFAPRAGDAAAHAAGFALYQELYRTARLEAYGSRMVTG